MRVAVFLLSAFSFSWAIAAWLHGAGGLSGASPTVVGVALLAYMFGPAVGAALAAGLYDRASFLTALGLRPLKWAATIQWMAIGWAVPLLLILAATALTLALLGTPPADGAQRLFAQASAAAQASGVELPLTAQQLLLITLAVNLPIGILVNTVLITFNEELGWRGWLYNRIAHLGFWRASLITGLLWGLWHAPIVLMGYNYPGLGWLGVGMMVALSVLLSPYFTLVRERGGNVWAAGAMHGSVNGATGLSLLFIPQPAWPYNGLLGVGGAAVLVLGWGAIGAYRLRVPRRADG